MNAKRKRLDQDHSSGPSVKRRSLTANLEPSSPFQAGVRPEEIDEEGSKETDKIALILSPAETDSDPVAYWALHRSWPANFSTTGRKMSSGTSTKRKSESTWRSTTHRTAKLARMQNQGIITGGSNFLQPVSAELCNKLLKGNLEPVSWPGFPGDRVQDVLRRAAISNEARIQRDVLPLVVPSVENLYFWGDLRLEHFQEAMDSVSPTLPGSNVLVFPVASGPFSARLSCRPCL
ncbi:MAG: hypothetical protein LQ340_002519 [Diploschistes diacapsis]|nr:MAG: hypothetical protein LQ340_002519 [Diploschistes diacapsis]